MTWHPIPRISKEEAAAFNREYREKARFLVDESVDPAVAKLLRDSGFNCKHVTEVGLTRHPDENVLGFAQREDRILLTHDPDFLNDRTFPPQRNPGIIVLPGAKGDRRAVLRALNEVLPIVGTRRNLWRSTKIVIDHEGTWTVRTFDRDVGRITQTRYRFRKNRPVEEWLDD